ncbi:MAG TPA: dihydropteroate synthase [Nitrospira sp.]|nr:dihydropteroate synthase [Nitrospira sp.]
MRSVQLAERPLIMGIVNVTPDSFYDGGHFFQAQAATEHAVRLVEEGADILDIGAESTRPGSLPVDEQEERRRLIPVVTAVAKAVKIPISVDTTKASVARAAIDAGAAIVNDVTALRGDSDMATVVANTGAGVVLMHMQGTPGTMQEAPFYRDVVAEVSSFFEERIAYAEAHHVARTQIILDPGIGFGKLVGNNLELLSQLRAFGKFGRPVLIGLSRKGFLGKITGRSVEDRLWGTAAAVALAVDRGAHIIRVHDVAPMRDVVKVAAAIAQRNLSQVQAQHA